MNTNINKPAKLFLCGLGIFPPYTASLDVLHGLSRCDVLFNNVAGPEVRQLLSEFCADIRPASYQAWQDEPKWADKIFAELDKGRKVGFVTRGHPLVCGGLACSLMEESGRRDVDFAVYGAVSSMDTLAIETADGAAGFSWGHQVLDYSSVFSDEFTLDTRLPAVIYFNATALALSRREHARFCEAMERLYSASQLCYFYGRSFHVKPDLMRLSELRGRHGKIDPSFTLLMPPVKSAGK